MQTAELAILNFIQQLRSEPLDAAMVFISWTGDHGMVWIALALLLVLLKRQRYHGLSAAGALILEFISCNLILKPLVGRLRPFTVVPGIDLLVPPLADGSFPSGHTAASFAVVFALKASGNPLWKPALVWAALMAFSRLYLYVHWPTDVLGGIVLGAVMGWLGAKLAGILCRQRKGEGC